MTYVGQSLKRFEDHRLLAGGSSYVDDIKLPGMVHALVLRSPHAHARIMSIDTSKAKNSPGIFLVMTGAEAAEVTGPTASFASPPCPQYCLAVDRVRHVGEAVAAVVAESRYLAEDAIDLIEVAYEALPVVVDPEAAAVCHAVGVSQTVTVSLGHKLDPRWGKPIEVTGTVERLSDGRFTYSGGVWDGVEAEMGLSAVLEIGSIRVLVTTNATYDWRDEQFRCAGLDPATAKFIVAKNPMNFREAYGALTNTFIILDTPGPTPATVKHVEFQRLERPFFPADEDIPGMRPVILS